ncbi:MAG: hypothetical protein ABI315_01280 [Bacteroidia bacterium]
MKIKLLKISGTVNKPATLFLTSIIALLVTSNNGYSQEIEYKKNSIITGVGLGVNEGDIEVGLGMVYSVGWQQNVGEKNRLRINPNLTFGGFTPLIISDAQDQFYKITTLGLNIHYDLIKYKGVSMVTTIGGFVNYSRGLLGTGGRQNVNVSGSEYFHSIYFGGNASIGLRIEPKESKLAYEFRPINVHGGNKDFVLIYIMFGIDFKLRK